METTNKPARRITDGWLLIGCGILHTLVGVVLGWPDLVRIGQDALFNAVYGVDLGTVPGLDYDGWVEGFANLGGSRPKTFWFLMAGFAWIILGALCQWIEHTVGRRVPRFVGVTMTLYAVTGVVLMPVSGFPVLAACSAVIVIRHSFAPGR